MRESAPTPATAFQNTTTLHLAFMAACFMYLVVAEVIRLVVDDFAGKGFNDMDDGLAWGLRAALLVGAVAVLALTRTVLSDESVVPRILKNQAEVNDTTLAAALQSAHIIRLAATESIAIFGLVLYMQTGDRIDYVFLGLSFLPLLALRPTRDHWNEMYRSLSVTHSGVSSSLSLTG
jgi:hypothetical protein